MTAKLWDMATSGPYCHRGDCATVSEAILAHGAEASESRDRFLALPETDKRAVIAFLLSLGRGELLRRERHQPLKYYRLEKLLVANKVVPYVLETAVHLESVTARPSIEPEGKQNIRNLFSE